MQYRKINLFHVVIAAFALPGGFLWGCGNAPQASSAQKSYFSLERYFHEESQRLARERPTVEKTVMKNDQQERRSLSDVDWETELNVFRNADINKPAWRDRYKVDSLPTGLRYQALDQGLKVRSIRITQGPSGNVTGIVIERSEDNYLYQSEETLRYYPDSLYSVERHQDVRVLGPDQFRITGRFR